ncbi:hypothetical protein CPB84DRAFT_1817953 [Gymnopilus junonius]|uniref:Helix-turn-helix DNA-binding domain-containing protein n=1 Tax=Gymnopilus junonius TaxID=109634 RepID=A0A9P5N869_GYMJU|nr:hypothetical protein CPB84DRAFT_1817953 [Gymnopilus junonius]
MWVTTQLSPQKTKEFFTPDRKFQHLKGALVLAVTFALLPYIWAHKCDYIYHFDINDIKSHFELLELDELWQICSWGQKYRSLLECRRALSLSYERLQVKDEYYEEEIQPQIDSVELVADATEWLSMKYKDKKQDSLPEFHFHDDDEPDLAMKRHKMPSRIFAYEVTKKSIISKLAEKFSIQPHQVVLNFLASHHVHFVDDEDLNLVACAEQFADIDPAKAQAPEELLCIHKNFKEDARVTVEPTECGITKNFKYLLQKPIANMLNSAQFLHILAAKTEHLVTVDISMAPKVKCNLFRQFQ